MARITVIRNGRSARVSAEVAEKMIRRGGAMIDTKDERGCKAWLRYADGRPYLGGQIVAEASEGLPEGWRIDDSSPPWHTVYDENDEKVGTSKRDRGEALRMAVLEAEKRARGFNSMVIGN